MILMRLTVFALALFLPGSLVGPVAGPTSGPQTQRQVAAKEQNLQEQTIIIAVDWSQSMSLMDPPHQIEAAINHFIDVSRLTGGRIKLVFIFFHGQTVEVIAGPDGLAAVGSEAMRTQCREYLSKPCSGATPLDGALEAVNKALEQSVSKNKTLVIISDGEPTTSIRPEVFGPVKEAIEKEEAKREKKGGRQAVAAYQARLRDWQSEESKFIQAIQQPLLFERCLNLAAKTNQHNVRAVSLAFTPDLAKLRQIHDAVGGAPEDFVFIDEKSLFARIHERQVFDSVLALPVIESAAIKKLEATTAFSLAGDLRASCLVVVELDSIPDLDRHSTMLMTVDGQAYRHTTDNVDDRIVVSRDAKGRLATLSTVAAPAQSGSFEFKSHKDDMTFPGLKVYRYVEAPKNLQFVVHPESLSANEPSGFEVNQFSNEKWLCGLSWLNGATIPLKSADIVFRHRESNRDFMVDTSRAQHFNHRFKVQPPELPLGLFDVFLRYELESGLTFETRIESHFKVVGVKEIIKMELFDDSNAMESVDFGLLGDVDTSRTVKVKLHSATPHDLDILITTVGLEDSQGNAVGQSWITVSDPTINIPAGESAELKFECSIPDEVPDDVVDGLFESHLEIINAKTLQKINIEPLIEGTSDTESLKRLLFTLRRPSLIVEAHYARRQWIVKDGDDFSLELNANVSTPFSRPVTFTVKTTSAASRDVAVRIANLRQEDGSAQSKIDVLPDNDWVGPKPIESGTAYEYRARFVVEKLGPDDPRRSYGKVIISGNGMRPVVINMVAGEGKSWARTIWFWFVSVACICGLVVIRMWRRIRKLKQLTPGKPRRFRAGEPVFGMFEFKAIDGQIMLVPKKPIEVKDTDGAFYQQKNPMLVDSSTPIPVRIRDKDKVEIEIQKVDAAGKQIFARVASARINSKKLRRAKRRLWLSTTTATTSILLLVLMQRWQPATRIVQYLIDVSPFA
jgi:hypothetical protein